MTGCEKKYAESLSRLIRKETVSTGSGSSDPKFTEFHQLLKEEFPTLFSVCEYENFDGSLLLRWKGTGKGQNPVLFMNHFDVVEAPGVWKHEPFSGEITDGKVWGRGTMDTKSGLWGMLQAAEELAAEGFVPPCDIYFESACTEETNGSGAKAIAAELLRRRIRFDFLIDEGGYILNEPISGAKGTFAVVGMGEKGCATLRFTAKSKGGHASTPGKNTSLVRLGKFMAEVERKSPFERQLSPVICEMFRRLAPSMGGVGILLGHPVLFGPLLKKVMPSVSPVAGALLQTTLAFTMAGGSQAANVLPQEAWVIGNMRYSHHQGLEASVEALRPVATKYDIEIEILSGGHGSGLADYQSRGFALIEEAVKTAYPQVAATVPYIMTGASDASYFDSVCSNCFRFIPYLVNDQQVASIHGLNENIDTSTLEKGVQVYKYMMQHLQ